MSDGRTVMVVEDDDDTREAVGAVLAASGYEVQSAVDGEDALQQLHSDAPRPCAILLDLMLPRMDGWTFRQVQRGDPELSSIPVALVTAAANVRTEARQLGGAAVFEKPAVWLDDMLAFVDERCSCSSGAGHLTPDAEGVACLSRFGAARGSRSPRALRQPIR